VITPWPPAEGGRERRGASFYHRRFGRTRFGGEGDGDGTTAHATHSRDSAPEMVLAPEPPRDGPQPRDQSRRRGVGHQPGHEDRADVGRAQGASRGVEHFLNRRRSRVGGNRAALPPPQLGRTSTKDSRDQPLAFMTVAKDPLSTANEGPTAQFPPQSQILGADSRNHWRFLRCSVMKWARSCNGRV
jgi:hypothetical protein